MNEIDVLQKIGTITDAVHDQLQKKFQDELDKTVPKEAERRPIDALKTRSALAASITICRYATNPLNSLDATAKAQLEEQRKGLNLSPETIKQIKDGAIAVTPVTF